MEPTEHELDEGYRQMAEDNEHEAEALEWIEALIADAWMWLDADG
jgi:hypothetical protein